MSTWHGEAGPAHGAWAWVLNWEHRPAEWDVGFRRIPWDVGSHVSVYVVPPARNQEQNFPAEQNARRTKGAERGEKIQPAGRKGFAEFLYPPMSPHGTAFFSSKTAKTHWALGLRNDAHGAPLAVLPAARKQNLPPPPPPQCPCQCNRHVPKSKV
jgi:hypothetical protein